MAEDKQESLFDDLDTLRLLDGHTEEGANDGAVTSLREKNESGRSLTERERCVHDSNDSNDESESNQLQDPISTCDSGSTVEIILPHTPTPSLPEALDNEKERLAEAQVWRRKDDGESEVLSLEALVIPTRGGRRI